MNYICRACAKLKVSEWRKANKDKIRETGARWRKHNRDKVQANKRRWRTRNPEKARESVRKSLEKYVMKYKEQKWKSWIKKKYGVTEEQFNQVLQQQGYTCAICKGQQDCGNRRKLYVDHCHKTNTFRALLCFKCNTMLGMAGDNPDILTAAIQYLRQAQEKAA